MKRSKQLENTLGREKSKLDEAEAEIKTLQHDNTKLEDELHDKNKEFEEGKRQTILAQCKLEE